VTLKNTERGSQILLYDNSITDSKDEQVNPSNVVNSSALDCINVKFIKIKQLSVIVCCHVNTCLIYNSNATRLLFKFDFVSP
jgi:hypothetical protein